MSERDIACAGGRIAGVILAAGLGRRFGMPKALATTSGQPWVLRALAAVADLDAAVVVTGARGADVRALLPDVVISVDNPHFVDGMGSSLAAGLGALGDDIDAAMIMLVDLPDVTDAVVRRVASRSRQVAAGRDGGLRSVLSRARYDGTPGHPVLLGAAHFAAVAATAHGDRGARDYLSRHDVVDIDCSDLASGIDQDTP